MSSQLVVSTGRVLLFRVVFRSRVVVGNDVIAFGGRFVNGDMTDFLLRLLASAHVRGYLVHNVIHENLLIY
jgi:hypothetical protein